MTIREQAEIIRNAMNRGTEALMQARLEIPLAGSGPLFPEEEGAFSDWLVARRPRRILELGSGEGGFSVHLVRGLAERGIMASLDHGMMHGLSELLKALALPGQTIEWLQADSRLAETRDRVLDILGEAPDMIFLDTDHEFETTKREVELWWPTLAPGGAMGFHDITPEGGVREVWMDLVRDKEFQEFRQPGNTSYGIGVVLKE